MGGFFRIFRLFRTRRKRHPVPMTSGQLIQLRRTKRNDFDKVPQPKDGRERGIRW